MANLAVLPSIADLYGRGRLLELQLILQRTAAFASVPALLAGVALILWPGLTIGLIFGDQYRMASTTTAILVSGQLTFALAGACGCALTMTGHHHTVLSINCLSAAILLLAGPLAARMWGAPGIASVTAVAIALQSFLSWARARRILGISTHASWGAFRSPRLIECRQEA
jgi:O-antigen/teichoic acid export membrane protein